MPDYKLYYPNLRFRGESSRLLFQYAGKKFEDIRVELGSENWAALKPKMPMGQMPVLEVDGKMLSQSKAIARYLAREFDLTGKTNWEMAQADMLVDGVFDMMVNMQPVYMPLMQGDMEAVKVNWEKFKVDHLTTFLERYQKFFAANKSGWLVGDGVTWADLVVSEFLSLLQDCFSPDALKDHCDLKHFVEKVQGLPQLKCYIASRPKTSF